MKPEKIEKMRFWMGSKLPKWMYKIAVLVRVTYKRIKMPEQRKSYGNLNPDKTFFVIRLFPPATGFLANYNYVLGYMRYAYDKGWIPVVDMENYATLYQEEKPVNGTRNVWEYFFEQPYDPITKKRYTLEEVYKSKNVVLAKADDQAMYDNSLKPEVLEWQHKMSLLVPFKENMQKHIDEVAKECLPNNIRVLGVPTRGSEQKKRVIGHPIAMNVEEIMPIIKDRCKEWKINHVFVKAEEAETIQYLERELENVHYSKCDRIRNYNEKKDVNASISKKSVSKSESLSDYLTDIRILSMCNSIIGTENNGLTTAIIWNGGKYEHFEIIDNGVWS
jgi:hypothetical protein